MDRKNGYIQGEIGNGDELLQSSSIGTDGILKLE